MNALGQRIAALIAAQGPISIAEFMTVALHDPQNGYYATRDPFGASGDFITAPEISQVLGELLGLWCVQVWHDQGKPARKRLVELGPGRGTLMNDVLRALRVAPDFLDGLEVVLVEASAALTAIQKEMLQDSGAEIRWTDRFESVPANRPLFLLANEFFDALPIHQYVKTSGGWRERMVTVGQDGALRFALAPVAVHHSFIPPGREAAPEGGVCEISEAASAMIAQIADAIATHGGGALIVDYGYDRPGFGETLQAVASHSFTNILDNPGESDLSAHVDFSFLAGSAWPTAESCGPVTQGEFLKRSGIVQRFERLMAANPSSAEELKGAMDRLIRPDQMGTLFKALAIVPKTAPKPPGF